jgi:hypothetical protein
VEDTIFFSMKDKHPFSVDEYTWRVKAAIGIWLAGCVVVFVVRSMNWPLVNDAALIHYVAFLMDHGFKPYRDIVDPNMPGSYLIDWTVIHTLGAGARGSRLYDLLLMLAAAAAMFATTQRRSWFAGFYAACLFALFHGRDGMAQISQRDLSIAVVLLVAIAFAAALVRQERIRWALGLGLTIGAATTIKPYALAFVLLFIPIAALLPSSTRRVRLLFAACTELLIPLCVAVVYLCHDGAMQPFFFVLFAVDSLHAHLGYRGMWYLIKWCLPSSLLGVVAFGLMAVAMTPPSRRNVERSLLLAGIVVGLIAYFVQMKGYPYHRYPLVACLLLYVSLELTEAMKCAGKPRLVGIAGLLFGTIVGTLYMQHAIHSRWPNDMEVALESDLNAAGGVRLNRSIQCIDSISGCSRVLYDMGLIQSTGMMYDEFLFVLHPKPALLIQRQRFLDELEETKPRVIVVTPDLFPDGPGRDKKLTMWPDFNRFLANCYDERVERSFPHGVLTEPGYRVYEAISVCRTRGEGSKPSPQVRPARAAITS